MSGTHQHMGSWAEEIVIAYGTDSLDMVFLFFLGMVCLPVLRLMWANAQTLVGYITSLTQSACVLLGVFTRLVCFMYRGAREVGDSTGVQRASVLDKLPEVRIAFPSPDLEVIDFGASDHTCPLFSQECVLCERVPDGQHVEKGSARPRTLRPKPHGMIEQPGTPRLVTEEWERSTRFPRVELGRDRAPLHKELALTDPVGIAGELDAVGNGLGVERVVFVAFSSGYTESVGR